MMKLLWITNLHIHETKAGFEVWIGSPLKSGKIGRAHVIEIGRN